MSNARSEIVITNFGTSLDFVQFQEQAKTNRSNRLESLETGQADKIHIWVLAGFLSFFFFSLYRRAVLLLALKEQSYK